jgi:hypothetical protein
MVTRTICLALAISAQALAAEPPDGTEATVSPPPTSVLERLRELAAACAHLEAAGTLDLARQTREEANRLLEQERARLAQEQAALSKVEDALAPPQFVIQAILIEAPNLPLERLASTVRQLGGRQLPHDVHETAEGAFAAGLAGETGDADLLDALAASGVEVNVLSRPQVRTLQDRPAQIQIGETRPGASPQIAEEVTGIALEVTPRRAAEGKASLETWVERSWLEDTKTTLYVDPVSGAATTSPVKSSYTVCTDLKCEMSRVLLLAVRPAHSSSAVPAARATLIVLLRPRQVPEQP